MAPDIEIEPPLKSNPAKPFQAHWPAPTIAVSIAVAGLVLNRHGGGVGALVLGGVLLLAVAVLMARRFRA